MKSCLVSLLVVLIIGAGLVVGGIFAFNYFVGYMEDLLEEVVGDIETYNKSIVRLHDETGIVFSNEDNVVRFYNFEEGNNGMSYFVFYLDDSEEFFTQFDGKELEFNKNTNDSLESSVLAQITNHVGGKYSQIDSLYKINFDGTYYYNEFPMIYDVNTNRLTIVHLYTV